MVALGKSLFGAGWLYRLVYYPIVSKLVAKVFVANGTIFGERALRGLLLVSERLASLLRSSAKRASFGILAGSGAVFLVGTADAYRT